MRIILSLVGLLVFVAGCQSAGPKWTKDGAAANDFKIAHDQCEAQAIGRANAIATHIAYAFYAGCMQAAGWTPPPAPKEEHHEEPKKVAKMDAFKEEREKNAGANHGATSHDAAKSDGHAAEAPRHDAPAADTPKHWKRDLSTPR